ncbi:MAG TPA: hypothetical protein VGB64_09555 [Actinomycetota bacterium]
MRTSTIARGLATAVAIASLAFPGVSQAATRQYFYGHSNEPCPYAGPNNPCNHELSTPRGNVQSHWSHVEVIVSGSVLRIVVDDLGALDGQSVYVRVRQSGFEYGGCVQVRTLKTITGLAAGGAAIEIGPWDQGTAVFNGDVIDRCSAPASAGILTVDGVS